MYISHSVLDNVTLNTATSAKFISSSGRSIDLSKITVLNPLSSVKGSSSSGNVLLMPDGKLKNVGPSSKPLGNISVFNKVLVFNNFYTGAPRYITSKKQLLGNRPPKISKKPSYISTNTIQTNLPPPANLTSQDIMDLPIVFADDNQILTRDNTIKPDVLTPNQAPPPYKITNPTSTGKFVFVNKQVPLQSGSSGNIIISPANIKKSTVPVKTSSGNPIKFTKIILTKQPLTSDDGKNTSSLTVSKIAGLPSEITVKKLDPATVIMSEPIDLENELIATAVPNPNCPRNENVKNMAIITKRPDGSSDKASKPLQVIISEALAKRSAKEITEDPDSDDPDYIPPKNIKLDKV